MRKQELQQTVLHEQTGKQVTFAPAETGGAVNTVREYVTSDDGERPPFQKFVSTSAYEEALSSIVIKTVDAVIYDPETGRVLVGTRNQEPQPGDFVFGGRKYAGHSDKETAVYNIRRELGAAVAKMAEDRLLPVGTQYDMIWDSRDQDSTVNEEGQKVAGSHQSSTLFALPVSEAEFDAAVKHNEEYSHLRWVDGMDIIDAPPGVYHPTFQDMVFDTLERVVTQPNQQPALR